MYFGWYIVAFALAVYALLPGVTFNSFGLFVVPVAAEYGLSRANMNTALILLNIGNAFCAPVVGRLIDRYPLRPLMYGCTLLFGASLAALTVSPSLWLSAFIMLVPLAFALQGAGTLTVSVIIPRWFVAQRGRALTLAALGLSAGNILVAPAMGAMIQNLGWREALLWSAGTVTLLLLLGASFVREYPRPGEDARERAAAAPAGQPGAAAAPPSDERVFSIPTLLRTSRFWTISLGVSLSFASAQAFLVSLVPLAIDSGIGTIKATGLISMSGAAGFAGKLLLSVFADRVDRIHLLAALFVMCGAGFGALLVGSGYGVLLVIAALMGVTMATVAPVFNAVLADTFGTRSLGTVRGLTFPLISVLGAIAVRGSGEIYDRTGNYDLLFIALIVVQLVAAALISATRLLPPAMPHRALQPAL